LIIPKKSTVVEAFHTLQAIQDIFLRALKDQLREVPLGKPKEYQMEVDRKFSISAVCRAHGDAYTEGEGVFFKAADAAFNRTVLDAYKREAIKLGAHSRQIKGIELLIERVEAYKDANPAIVKVPDVDEGENEEHYVNRPNMIPENL